MRRQRKSYKTLKKLYSFFIPFFSLLPYTPPPLPSTCPLNHLPTPTSPPAIPTHHAGLSVPVQQPASRRLAAALRVHRMPALGARAVQAVELQPAHHARPHLVDAAAAAVVAGGTVADTVGAARAKARGRRRCRRGRRWQPPATESAVVLGRRLLVRRRVG